MFIQNTEEDYQGFFLNSDDEITQFLDAFSLSPTETNRLINIHGVAPEVHEKAEIDRFISNLDVDFPSSDIMSSAARQIQNTVYDHEEYIISNPDSKLIDWTDMESLGFFTGHFLLPTRSCYVKFHGLKLIAESGGTVIVDGNSIAQTVVKYGTSTSKPEKQLRAIESHMHKTVKKDGHREASDQDLSNRPIYFKSTETTRDIWRIWLTD